MSKSLSTPPGVARCLPLALSAAAFSAMLLAGCSQAKANAPDTITIAPESVRNLPIAASSVDAIDGEIGKSNVDSFQKSGYALVFNFDSAEYNDAMKAIAFGKNIVHFTGLQRESRKEYFFSGDRSLVGVGKNKEVTASLAFDQPVKGVGFILQFKTGTAHVTFYNADGEKLFEVEQNGQGDPSGNGTWADYFVGFSGSNEFGEIARVDFMRYNLNDGAVPEFAIDNLTVLEGEPMREIVMPEIVTSDLSLLQGGGVRDIAPQRGSAGAVSANGNQIVLRGDNDHSQVAYTMDAAQGLSSLSMQFGDDPAISIGKNYTIEMNQQQVSSQLKQFRVDGNTAILDTVWQAGAVELPVSITLSLSGNSLLIDLASQVAPAADITIRPPVLTGIKKISDSQDTAMRSGDALAFLGFGGDIFFLLDNSRFYSYFVDWTRSNASAPYSSIHYDTIDGVAVAPLQERIAITIDNALDKVLPTIPNPVSQYRELIGSSMIMEFWYGHFDELSDILETAHAYGMDDMIVLMHRWQHAGFDQQYPTVLPPSPSRGGLGSLQNASAIAQRNGQRIALHENYKDFYPDSGVFNEDDLLMNSAGGFQNAWADSKEMAPSKIRKYAEPVMNEIKSEIGTNACFLDVHSTHLPWWRVDYRPGVPMRGMFAGTLQATNRLWEMARTIYQGPVFGESYALTSWIHTGNVDAVMGQASESVSLILDFLLLKIRPLATNHGAGYFERWNPRGYTLDWPSCPLQPQEYARYSLQEVAFQTAPTVDDKMKKEFSLMATQYFQKRKIVSQLVNTPVKALRYFTVDGKELTSSQAALMPRKEIQRLQESYADGTEIYLNFSDTPWVVNESLTLAPLSFRAAGGAFEAETNCVDGVYFETYRGADGIFVNARNYDAFMNPKGSAMMGRSSESAGPVMNNDGTAVVTFENITTSLSLALEPENDGKALRLRYFPHAQAGFAEITLQQQVQSVQPLDREGKELAETLDQVQFSGMTLRIDHRDSRVWSYRITL